MADLYLEEIRIRNVKSYREEARFELSPSINIITGKNNSGKSTILKCLQLLQIDSLDGGFILHLARDENGGEVDYKFSNWDRIRKIWNIADRNPINLLRCRLRWKADRAFQIVDENNPKPFDAGVTGFRNVEPENLFVYFLGKRKVAHFEASHNLESSSSIRDDLRNLSSKIAKIKGASKPVSDEFNRLCEEVIGIDISTIEITNGIQVGIYVDEGRSILLQSMGEGVSHIVALIAELCSSSRRKIFLIEELENDLHPEALKALLNLILKHSSRHQFIISTHSNIVLRHLGSHPNARLFNLEMRYGEDRLPVTSVEQIKSVRDRHRVLQSLGYDAFDFGLWAGYLILEESSAQAIVERILIPYFVPTLAGKLKIISANGASKVEASYTDFHRMYVYLHTSEIYNKTSWVIVDGDAEGRKAIANLSKAFQSVEAGHFMSLQRENFELYYPVQFQEEAAKALAIQEKQAKWKAKSELVEKVKKWATGNPEEAKSEFQQSAAEVINILQLIAGQLTRK